MKYLHHNFKSGSRRGFTLAEVTIAVALSAVIAMAIAGAIFAASRSYRINSERARLLAESRKLMLDLSSDIRSSDIHSPIDVITLNDIPPDYQNGNTSQGLKVEAQLTGSDIQNGWYDAGVASSVQSFYRQIKYYYTDADHQVKTREAIIRRYSDRPTNDVTNNVEIAGTQKNDTVSYYVQGFEVRTAWTQIWDPVIAKYVGVLDRCVFEVVVANSDAAGGKLFIPGNQTNSFRLTESVMPRRNFRSF